LEGSNEIAVSRLQPMDVLRAGYGMPIAETDESRTMQAQLTV